MSKSLTKNNSSTFNPWSVFRNEMWDVFDRFSRELDMPLSLQEEFVPKIEVKEEDNSYHICAEVPGMNEKDINITLKDNNLIIEGEKKNETKNEDKKKGVYHTEFSYGHFYRAIPLSDDVDAEKVNAFYKDGLLSIELGKLPEKTRKNRKIQINSGKTQAISDEGRH